MANETQILNQIKQNICIILDANSKNDQRNEANVLLNNILLTECLNNIELYMTVGLLMISSVNDTSDCGLNIREIFLSYGFNIVETLVKNKWQMFNLAQKEQLKNECVRWCMSPINPNQQNNSWMSSSLVLNSCSRVIVEIFIQEWPFNWQNFINDITQTYSLITLYFIHNISLNIFSLQIPKNPIRRKEISKSLIDQSNKINLFILNCFSINSDNVNNQHLQNSFNKLLLLKCLELLESLFEWYSLSPEIITKVINISMLQQSIDNKPMLYSKLICFRNLNILINRQNNRLDDNFILNDIFFDFQSEKFAHRFITDTLECYWNYLQQNDSDDEMFKLFLLVLDVAVNLMCRSMTIYNLDSTNATIRQSIVDNKQIWTVFVQFCIKLLKHNNAILDEVLLKFLFAFLRLADNSSNTEPAEADKCSPIYSIISEMFQNDFLSVIVSCKLNAKSKSVAEETELRHLTHFDSYESYLNFFNVNRSKFLSFFNKYTSLHSSLTEIFVLNILNAIQTYCHAASTNQFQIESALSSWNITATVCSSLIPKIQFSSESQQLLQSYFECLLNYSTNVQNPQIVSNVLSCLSSMSPFYKNFPQPLTQKLIELIFEFSVRSDPNHPRKDVKSLQDHCGSLFIKLSANCTLLLMPFFDLMCSHIENLITSQSISNLQVGNLYEGLIILSNNFDDIELQRRFFVYNLLPKVNWITNYDFGDNGINFFTDIGLNREPDFSSDTLTFYKSEKFKQFMFTINVLPRLFYRTNPSRIYTLFWPDLVNYITPFYKLLAIYHKMWNYFEDKNLDKLKELCHSFYYNFIFDPLPHVLLARIITDQTFLLPKDPLKVMMQQREQNPNSPISPQLFGLHVQNRLWMLYLNTLNFLSIANNSLFYFYNANSTSQAMIESIMQQSFQLLCSNIKSMPLILYFDLMKQYFCNFVRYSPRLQSFLNNSSIINVLSDFLPFMFGKLNDILVNIHNNKEHTVECSDPFISKYFIEPFSSNQTKSKDDLEVCKETSIKCIAVEFVNLLNAVFSQPKTVPRFLVKFQFNIQSSEDNDMQDMEETCPMKNESKENFTEEGLLSASLLSFNPSPVVIVVSNCLLWPLENSKSLICSVNDRLFRSLVKRQLVQTPDGFYYLAERIIRAVMQTEQTESELINQLVMLLLYIYEEVVVKLNLVDLINPQLSSICEGNVNQWNNFAKNIATGSNLKNRQKTLRSLLSNVTFKGLSSLHSHKQLPVAHLVSQSSRADNFGNSHPTSDETYTLSWLFLNV